MEKLNWKGRVLRFNRGFTIHRRLSALNSFQLFSKRLQRHCHALFMMERTIVCQRNGENKYKMYVFVAVTKRVAAGNYAFGGGCLMSQRDLHQPLIFQKELHINIQLLFSISYITLFQFSPCYSFHPLFTQCLFPFLFPFVIFSLISLVQTNQQMKLSMYSHCKQNCVKFQKVCIRLTRQNKCWQCLQTRGMLKLFFRFNFHFFCCAGFQIFNRNQAK